MSLLQRFCRRRPNAPFPVHLALNLSYVLHERSGSAAVRDVVAACRTHAAWLDSGPVLPRATTDGAADFHVQAWLTATIGLHRALGDVLHAEAGYEAVIIPIDGASSEVETATLFRAEAALWLPVPTGATIGVASLVARPGRRDTHRAVAGPFRWPDERVAALRQMERLIQRDADQWVPTRALWAAPAEVLLAGEVV